MKEVCEKCGSEDIDGVMLGANFPAKLCTVCWRKWGAFLSGHNAHRMVQVQEMKVMAFVKAGNAVEAGVAVGLKVDYEITLLEEAKKFLEEKEVTARSPIGFGESAVKG